MEEQRWQIISDDSVWMFPPDKVLSTVFLNSHVYRQTPYESCIFYADGESEVLARYETQEEAELEHVELEKKYGLKRCIK